MGFSDKLQINKVTTREPENADEWLQRFIEIILKESSNFENKETQGKCGRRKEALASKKEKEKSNGKPQ